MGSCEESGSLISLSPEDYLAPGLFSYVSQQTAFLLKTEFDFWLFAV